MKYEDQPIASSTAKKLTSTIIADMLKHNLGNNPEVVYQRPLEYPTDIEYQMRIAYNYCEWALLTGYKEGDIRNAFRHELEKHRQAATDNSLNNQQRNFEGELSHILISAYELLQSWSKKGIIKQWNSEMKSDENNLEGPKRRI